ncbi:MAG TPA: S46 family peptidase [Terriglobales bacterium]|nr:S46 family peptidase [Terriglobales bacterium]
MQSPRSRYLALCLLAVLFAALLPRAAADEGMWLFNAFPKAKVKTAYGFEPAQTWLDHVRLSSVRFNNGGSGSFVSADGLTFTNHHVGAECIQDLSKSGQDYMKTGFYAPTRAQEAKCPNLELNQLVGIEDVTDKVNSAVTKEMNSAQAGAAMRSAMAAIERDCNTSTGLRCDVVTFYSGGMYQLYKYKKYTDVRLVFAPEFDAAFFGGDPDNFNYPRYDLDITFFRVYENDKPAQLKDYLRWTRTGVKEGDLVLVSGNPGSTGRLLTVAQLKFLKDMQYPWQLASLKRRIAWLKDFAAKSPENARIAQEGIFSLENSLKAITGYNDGLNDPSLLASKQEEEKKLRDDVAADPKKSAEFGNPWGEIENAMQVQRQIFFPLFYFERRAGFRGNLCGYARDLVRLAAEKTKPNGERLREYRESNLSSVEQDLFSTAPIYKTLETAILTESLQEMQSLVKEDADLVRKVLNGKTPAQRADELIPGTKLDDVAYRKQLYNGGQTAIEASKDPLIVLMRMIDPEARKVRKQYDDQVDAVEKRDGGILAKARFAQGGLNVPPDATFTLRLSYGAVRGYEENGKHLPYFTTMGGAYEHAAEHGNKDPYQLPESWMKNKSKLDLEAPFNIVATPDIIGGNSGSPVINRDGEVVGIIFDGNIQSLAWRFAYSDKQARSIHVDARAIQEALRKIYGAAALADELMNGNAGAAKGK